MRGAVVGSLVLVAGLLQAGELNPLRHWDDYQVIMWVSGKTVAKPEKVPLMMQRLREMGVTAGMVTGDGDASMWKQAGMPFYVENIVRTGLCLKFRSPVTDWSKFVNQWMETRDESAFVRPYCLEDPAWLAESQKRMRDVAGSHRPNTPLLYDIRDELSVTTSANPFDYDFAPQSLAGFRKWLQKEYSSLEALNEQWDTNFPAWEEVRPFSTDQIKARMVTGERMPRGPPDWSALKQVRFDPMQAAKEPVKWNFSPWCDFRSYMDTVLANTLDSLRTAAHEVDPATPVGIEGTQMPHAFGGYDLWKLSQSVDWTEPYDVGNSRDILGSFMPGQPMLCTLFEKDTNHAMRRLWHLLLLGDKGCIVWWSEDCVDAGKDDFPLTEKAKALAPALREMQSPLAKLFMLAEREWDPIAIHYSQASIQVAWLLESVADGKTWPRRFSSFESDHNRHAAVRNGWLKLLQDAGYSPQFVVSQQFRRDAAKVGRIVVLPDSMALSGDEFDAFQTFLDGKESPHGLFGNSEPGVFDGHGKLVASRTFKPLAGLEKPGSRTWFAEASSNSNGHGIFGHDVAGQLKLRRGAVAELPGGGQPNGDIWFAHLTEDEQRNYPEALMGLVVTDQLHAILPPVIEVPRRACIRTHRYLLGAARLVAFERGVDYHMSEELKQAGGNESLEKPVSFIATITEKAHVYDLRSGAYLGERDEISVELDPWVPSLFALLREKLPEGRGVIESLLRDDSAKAR